MTDFLFTTEGLKPESQLEYWADEVCKYHTLIGVERWGKSKETIGFNARLIRHPLSQIVLSSALAEESWVSHSELDIAHVDERAFLVHMQYKGSSQNFHAGHEVELSSGDFTICDSTRPYDIELSNNNEMLLMKIPTKLMLQIVPNIEDRVGIKINGNFGVGAIASQAISSLWQHRNEIDPQMENQVVHNVLNLMAFSLNEGSPQKLTDSSVKAHHLQRVKSFIESNLSDPELSAPQIAEANHISLRYLHQVFSDETQTLGRYILERRLQCSSAMLQDQCFRHLSVTEIAHRWGFKDSSHFAHRFRQRFGMSPRAFRHGD